MKTVTTNRQGREFLGSARVNGSTDGRVVSQTVVVQGKASGMTIVLGLEGGKQITIEMNEKSTRAIELARKTVN